MGARYFFVTFQKDRGFFATQFRMCLSYKITAYKQDYVISKKLYTQKNRNFGLLKHALERAKKILSTEQRAQKSKRKNSEFNSSLTKFGYV